MIPMGIESKNSQLWTIIQKKKILIRTDFGATFLIHMIPMSLNNS